MCFSDVWGKTLSIGVCSFTERFLGGGKRYQTSSRKKEELYGNVCTEITSESFHNDSAGMQPPEDLHKWGEKGHSIPYFREKHPISAQNQSQRAADAQV